MPLEFPYKLLQLNILNIYIHNHHRHVIRTYIIRVLGTELLSNLTNVNF
jgi:hypothetical protein